MKSEGSKGAPPWMQPDNPNQQEWPADHYLPDKMLTGSIAHHKDLPQYRPRFDRYYEAYSKLEGYDSSVLRKRATEAIEVIARTRHSIEQETRSYLSQFEHEGGEPSGFNHRHFFTENITYLENAISFCAFVVSSVTIELRKRKEPIGDLSIAEGIRQYEVREANRTDA